MSLCFLVIFGNALDFRMYCTPDGSPIGQADIHDVNNIFIDERYNMCVACGTCLELLHWWDSKYAISTTTCSYGDSFSTHFLFSQVGRLWVYKNLAEADNRPGAPGCTKQLLILQINNILDLLDADKAPLSDDILDLKTLFSDVKASCATVKASHMLKSALDEKLEGEAAGLFHLGFSQEFQKTMILTCHDSAKEYGKKPDFYDI